MSEQSQNPNTEQNPHVSVPNAVTQNKDPRPVGPLVGIIIIIIILALGGFYFWGQRLVKEGILEKQETVDETDNDAALESLRAVGTSDAVGAIEEDVDATDLDFLDKSLEEIDTSLTQ